MTKYFSKDTPLASLERMMMSVPGFQKRGGGMMVLCRFHYKKEDVDCAYCQSYMMKHTIPISTWSATAPIRRKASSPRRASPKSSRDWQKRSSGRS